MLNIVYFMGNLTRKTLILIIGEKAEYAPQ